MGETQSSQHDSPSRIAAGLSPSMRKALATGVDTPHGTSNVYGNSNTLAALITRGLITPGYTYHYLTDLGRRVAYAAGIGVWLIDDLHGEALQEHADRVRARDHAPADATRCDYFPGARVTVGDDPRAWIVDAVRIHGDEPYYLLHSEENPRSRSSAYRSSLTPAVPGRTVETLRKARELHADVLALAARIDAMLMPAAPASDYAKRIADRAAYDALRRVLSALDGWTVGAKENHEAQGHPGESIGGECWRSFMPDDIRNMVNDAARDLGVREPYRPEERP